MRKKEDKVGNKSGRVLKRKSKRGEWEKTEKMIRQSLAFAMH